jgi:hypothetical protein
MSNKRRSVGVDEKTHVLLKKLADDGGYSVIGLIKILIKNYTSKYEKHNRNR